MTAPRSAYAVGEETRRALIEVVFRVQESLSDEWSLEAMAREAGFDVFHFAHAFRQLLGTSPAHYVRHLRLERAAHDLSYERLPLSRVAEEAGYSSQEAFRRAFRRAFGRAPAAFRRAPDPSDPTWSGGEIPFTEITSGPSLVELGPLSGVSIPAGTSPSSLDEPYARLVEATGACPPFARAVVSSPEGWVTGSDSRVFRVVRLATEDETAPRLPATPPLEPWRISGGTYVRFDFVGDDARLGPTITWLFATWLRTSGLRRRFAPALTMFDERSWAAHGYSRTVARVFLPVARIRSR